ncbi:MAG TPA: ComEC/Rec2 family competence protein [Dehalococcoidia bacterium]|nr:ComEC/Rec2 family competence protein [Dehalococcoidia bacterium]
MTLAYVSLAWAGGIYLGSLLHTPWFTIFAALVPLASLPFLSQDRKRYAILLALSLLALTGGSLRLSATQPATDPNSVSRYNQQGIQTIRGEVSAEPEAGRASATVRLKVQAAKENEVWTEATGVALLRQRPYPEYHQGDTLEVTGKLKTPEAGGESGYAEYLARQGIVSLMDYPRVTLVKRGTAGPAEWLRTLRARLSESIGSALPEPQASLAQAILLGERKDIPDYLNAAFARTGTMHLLAISGMNLSIVAGMGLAFAVWLLGRRRFIYVWVAIAGVWAYAALTGMYPPVFRAAAMATIFLLAEYFGRQGSALVAITFAGAVMVAIDPFVLWSVSFQLSFISMAGLILFTPVIQAWGRARAEQLVQGHPHLQGLADFAISSAAVTLGATLATWPLIAHYFGILSAVSLPANLAVVPALPLIMLSAAVTAVVGLAAPAAAWFAGWVAWPAPRLESPV